MTLVTNDTDHHNIMLEVNLLWAAHQVHHSAEDYNMTTALRQSAFQTFGGWVSDEQDAVF